MDAAKWSSRRTAESSDARGGPSAGAALRRPRRVGRRAAYTLVELLIIVALLGIAAALVIPNISSADTLRVQAAVRTIVADMTFAQSEALARQEGRALMFDTAKNLYRVVEVRGSVLNPDTDTISLIDFKDGRYGAVTIESAVFDAQPVLIFDPLGGPVTQPQGATPSAGGKVRLSGYGSSFDVAVEAYTGRVTVSRVAGP